MRKIVALTLTVLGFSYIAFAQFSDFPVGFAAVPKSKLNGPVRTVLFVEKYGDNIVGTEVSTYNQKGQILEALSSAAYTTGHSPEAPFNPETDDRIVQQSEKHIYLYDRRGLLVRMDRFIDERHIDYELYELDGKGRRISSKAFNAEGSPEELFLMNYLDSAREVRVTWQMYESGGLGRPNGAVLKYDKDGNWISRLMDIDDEPVTFEYDPHGNLVKEINCCKYNYWYAYTNKLDKYGNWIEREINMFQKNNNGTVEKRPETKKQFRVISYYDASVKNSK